MKAYVPFENITQSFLINDSGTQDLEITLYNYGDLTFKRENSEEDCDDINFTLTFNDVTKLRDFLNFALKPFKDEIWKIKNEG